MRIENAINEVQGPQPSERRNAEVKRRRGTEQAGDRVEISSTARSLGSSGARRADLSSVADVRQHRVEQARERVASGYYNRPEVQQAIADAVLDSGVVDSVGREVAAVRTAKEQLTSVPDVRDDRVAYARQRVASSYYDTDAVRGQIAERFLDNLIG